MNNVNPKQTKNDRCDVNFSKLKDRSVKVYMGTEKHQGVEIIGSKGKYAVLTDSKMKGYQLFVEEAVHSKRLSEL
jgi:hypothetical protein